MRASLQTIGRRPTLGVELGVVAAWALLAVISSGAVQAGGGGPGSPLWLCSLGGAGMNGMTPGAHGVSTSGAWPGAALLAAGLPMWALMAGAMMLPTALPAVRHVAANSLYWRRRRAMAEFVAVFLAVWTAFGLLVLGPLSAAVPAGSGVALATVLAVAALWQLTPLKRRAQRACHRSRPLPPYGWRASGGVARFALFNAGACLASCWALMLTMGVVGSARLAWMAALTTIVAAEKLSLKPRWLGLRISLLLAAAALGTAAAVVIS